MATISAEVRCNRTLYVWHLFAGRTGTKVDVNVLISFPLLQDILSGQYRLPSRENYKLVDGVVTRDMLYLLTDAFSQAGPYLSSPYTTRLLNMKNHIVKDKRRCPRTSRSTSVFYSQDVKLFAGRKGTRQLMWW